MLINDIQRVCNIRYCRILMRRWVDDIHADVATDMEINENGNQLLRDALLRWYAPFSLESEDASNSLTVVREFHAHQKGRSTSASKTPPPEIGRLGALFFPRASLFSNFLRTLARSSRAYLFVIVFSWLAVHFLVFRRVGSACAGSAPKPLLCGWLPCAPV